MEGMPAEEGIELLFLNLLRLQFLVARGLVAGGRLAFLARLRALDGHDFTRHKSSFLLLCGFLFDLDIVVVHLHA